MEDKTYELITKMYNEITANMKNINKKLDSKADKNDIIRMENKVDNDTKALYDGYNQTFEKLVAVENKVDEICLKVDKQDNEITIIRGSKKSRAK